VSGSESINKILEFFNRIVNCGLRRALFQAFEIVRREQAAVKRADSVLRLPRGDEDDAPVVVSF
jgi:hypothetical protein